MTTQQRPETAQQRNDRIKAKIGVLQAKPEALPQYESKTEFITPEIAQQYLDTSPGNRDVSNARVTQLAEEIIQKRWSVTPSGLAFDTDNKLRDGHHRLFAIIKAGIGVHMVVTRGVPAGVFTKVDIGKARSVSDSLHMLYGIMDARAVAMIGRVFYTLDKGYSGMGSASIKWGVAQQVEDILLIVKSNPRTFTFAVSLYNKGKRSSLPGPILGVLAYAYAIDPGKISDMANKLKTKIGIEANSPEAALVQFATSHKSAGLVHTSETMQRAITAVYMKLKGKEIKILRHNDTAYEELRAMRAKAGNL